MIVRELLDEWKNVSDEVINLTKFIGDKIINDSKNQKYFISDSYTVLMKEGFFNLKLPSYRDVDNKTINVRYRIYEVEDDKKLRDLLTIAKVNMNCQWSEETQTLEIVTAIVDNRLTSDFYESISHEVEHMFQYSIGMKKNANLYDKTIEMYKRGKSDIPAYHIAFAFYYTFKHEQDAFVQQFYQYLNNTEHNYDVDAALDHFDALDVIENIQDIVYERFNDERYVKAINELGFDRKAYFRRLHFSYNRLLKKMKNAYMRWHEEKRNDISLNEATHQIWQIKEQFRLTQKAKSKDIKDYNELISFKKEEL